MPAQERAYLDQIAVLWSRSGYDRYGQPKVSAPVEVNVRWNTKQTEMMDPNGNSILLDGSAVVGQRIAIGSHMWLGTLSEWTGTGSGSADSVDDDELMEVKAYNETPDLKARDSFITVGLMRLHQRGGN